MQYPKLSIITVTYNRAKYLVNALCSVKEQTFMDKEHIIIDNMSSDNTQSIIRNYIKSVEYPVKYIREKDNGIYNAMNKGIMFAKGTWIHFLHSDDRYCNSYCLENIFYQEINKYDLVSYSILLKYCGKNISVIDEPFYDKRTRHFHFPHTGIIFKKNVFDKFGLYNENFKIVSDLLFSYKYYPILKSKIIKYPLVEMLDTGISGKMNLRHYVELLFVVLFYSKESKKRKTTFLYNKTKQLLLFYFPILSKLKYLLKI